MSRISHTYYKDTGTMRVTLNREFSMADSDDLVKLYQERIASGVLNWDLDLRQLEGLNSMQLGMLVAFNTSVTTHGGKFRIFLQQNSRVADLLKLTKLDHIISVVVS